MTAPVDPRPDDTAEVIRQAEQLVADPCAACGHGRAVHSHHRRGLDCSFCQCDLWTAPGRARSGLAWFVTLAVACLTAWGVAGTLAWRHWA